MWEPFTEHARHAVVQAQEEAQGMGHGHIGTEHLLLALVDHGPVGSVLEGMDINLDAVRREARGLSSGSQPTSGEMVFTPNAKQAIELAFEEARRLQHTFIGCEHVLMGILRVPGTACRAMAGAGVQPDQLLTALRDRAAEAPRPPETLHLQAQAAARAHPGRLEGLPGSHMGNEALEILRSLREEVAAMRTELAGLRKLLAATPPPKD